MYISVGTWTCCLDPSRLPPLMAIGFHEIPRRKAEYYINNYYRNAMHGARGIQFCLIGFRLLHSTRPDAHDSEPLLGTHLNALAKELFRRGHVINNISGGTYGVVVVVVFCFPGVPSSALPGEVTVDAWRARRCGRC